MCSLVQQKKKTWLQFYNIVITTALSHCYNSIALAWVVAFQSYTLHVVATSLSGAVRVISDNGCFPLSEIIYVAIQHSVV